MSRTAYVNGRYIPHRDAAVHVEDRGYQFADGVYEVVPVISGRLIDEALHLDRLERSLGELRIDMPMTRAAFRVVLRETLRRNRITSGLLYFQVTRGVAPRDHPFPSTAVRPAVVVTAKPLSFAAADARAKDGVKAVTLDDIRWGRCDVKSTALLANVLAKQTAREQGGYEAILVDNEGFVTEGSSTNVWIADREGRLITRDLSKAILPGVTRAQLIRKLKDKGHEIVERKFTLEELKSAREVFLTSSSSFVMPVTQVDDQVIANGRPGSISADLRAFYQHSILAEEE